MPRARRPTDPIWGRRACRRPGPSPGHRAGSHTIRSSCRPCWRSWRGVNAHGGRLRRSCVRRCRMTPLEFLPNWGLGQGPGSWRFVASRQTTGWFRRSYQRLRHGEKKRFRRPSHVWSAWLVVVTTTGRLGYLRQRRQMTTEMEAKRARLVAIERELSRLGSRHDLAMSAFKFDEARELQRRITVLERERAELEAVLPAPAPTPPIEPVPVRIRARRPIPRRR